MGKITNLKRQVIVAAVCLVVIVGVITALIMIAPGQKLRVMNIAIPVVTLGLILVIGLRQRRTNKLSQARIKDTTDALARLAILSDALEEEYRSRAAPIKDLHASRKSAPFNQRPRRPTIH